MSKRKTWLNLKARDAKRQLEVLRNSRKGSVNAASARFTQTHDALSLSDTPYLNILENAKPSEIPQTFEECVDFFFPTSGVHNYDHSDSTAVPFTSTLVADYPRIQTSSPNSNEALVADVFDGGGAGNLLPKHLGDVSLMLGYFLLYRTLLAPKTFMHVQLPSAEDQVFVKASGSATRRINNRRVKRSRQSAKNLIKQFEFTKQILGSSLDAAQMAISGQIDIDNLTPQDVIDLVKNNPGLDSVLNEGVSIIVNELSSALGIHPKYMGIVAKHGLNFLSKGDFDNLDFKAKGALQTFAFNQLVDLGIPREEARLLRDSFISGEISPQLYSSLSQKAKDEFDKKKAEVERNLRTKVTGFKSTASTQLKNKLNIRSNPNSIEVRKNALVTLAVVGILGATKVANDKYWETQSENRRKDFRRLDNYFTSETLYLNPDIGQDLAIKLKLDDFDNRGLPSGKVLPRFRELDIYGRERWPNLVENRQRFSWNSSNTYQIPATCSVLNGGLVADFWRKMWMNFQEPIFRMRNDGNLRTALSGQPKASHKIPCPMFTPFEENAYSSLLLMLAELPNLSPFSFEFGFKPSLFDDQGKANLSGHASLAKKYGDLEYWDDRNGKKFKVTTLPDSPYVYHLNQDGHTDRIVSTPRLSYHKHDVNALRFSDVNQAWAKREPNAPFQIPSRRVLQGQIPQMDLHFDVGLNGFTPIFDAQWAALLSVLMMYPEARETVANAGISGWSWIRQFKQSLDNKHLSMQVAKKPTSSIDLTRVLTRPIPGFTPTGGGARTTSRRLAKSPLTRSLKPLASRKLEKRPLNRSLSPSMFQLDLSKIPKSTPPKSTTKAATEDTKSLTEATTEDTKSSTKEKKPTNTTLIVGGVALVTLTAFGVYKHLSK